MGMALVTLLSLAILAVGFMVGWWVGTASASVGSFALLALPVLLFGFAVGWLVEWVIDERYHRARRTREGATEGGDEPSKGHVILPTESEQSALTAREEEVDRLRAELEEQETRFEQLRARFDRYASTHPDDLTEITGIGRVYQWKLREAGISTFAQLASTTAEHIEQALQIKGWQNVDPASWIEEAQALIE